MSVDAVAVLPRVVVTNDRSSSVPDDAGWRDGEGPGGARGVFQTLADCTLLNLGHSFQSPDGDLFELARSWFGSPPARIWIFPDTAIPSQDTGRGIQAATRRVGRWIKADRKRRELFVDLGLDREFVDTFRRETASGDARRVEAALADLRNRLQGTDPAEVEAKLAAYLASLGTRKR
jgi:hypothetical protein